MSPAAASPPLPRRARALQRRVLSWYADNRRDLPWRHTTDPYAILVSEIMLQQTQVPRVAPRFLEWLEAWPDLESLAAAPLAEVLRRWQGLGYNNRARRLRECAAEAVAAAPDGGAAELPRTVDGLRALPGIGPYTARAVLIFAHNQDLAAVDANVRRVLTHELGLAGDLGDAQLQAVADALLPRGRSRDWHNALMDYGSLVLTARTTGIAPRTRQTAFEGSRRQQRARLLRRLLEGGPQPLSELTIALALPLDETADIVERLRRDGLVAEAGGTVSVATPVPPAG
jgi:A/G-specific adenine glycosylase